MLRNCASFANAAYAMRTVPPVLQQAPLQDFDADIQGLLEEMIGGPVPERCRLLLQQSLQHAGLGLRASCRHAPAAYLASRWQSHNICRAIDPSFDVSDQGGGLLQTTLAELNSNVLEPAGIASVSNTAISQKQLSVMLDAWARDALLSAEHANMSFRAHVVACSQLGAGVWLTATPRVGPMTC